MRRHHKKTAAKKTSKKTFFVFRYTRIIIPLLTIALGAFLYTKVLPYQFSGQKLIEPENLSGNYDFYQQKGTFHGNEFDTSNIPEPKNIAANILGDNTSNKRIEVDLTNQHLYAFEGDKKVYDFLVSTGLWGRTPTGIFKIWTKLRYTKMEGGNQALNTYYYLPNVPYVMFFSNAEVPASMGYSLHGTYWHNNFGHPMSHGCVNMRTEDVEKLYYWAQPDLRGKTSINSTSDNPGTQIIIYGTAPTS